MPSSSSPWDCQSVALAVALAATSISLALTGSMACQTKPESASTYLAIAATLAFTLLGFTLTCAAYRHWVAESISAPRLGPGQSHPRTRRALPALRSSGAGVAGLDKWSVLTIALAVLPAFGPLLSRSLKPKQHDSWVTVQQPRRGVADSANFSNSGATSFTTGAYEAITMSFQSSVGNAGSNRDVVMANTADVFVDRTNKRVIIPARVQAACMYERVRAPGLTAMVGEYTCAFVDVNDGQQLDCNTTSTGNAGKDSVCLSFKNSTRSDPVPKQMMTVKHPDLRVDCNVTYSLATVDVEWAGKNRGRSRVCQIADLTNIYNISKDPVLLNEDLMGSKNVPMLTLPLANAFVHAVDHARIKASTKEARELFYGSIFAAATIIRSTSDRFDPTASPGDSVQVQYLSDAVCLRYGWSWLVIMVLVLDILLVLFCIVLSSGTSVDLADLTQGTSETLSGFWNRPFTKQAPQMSMTSSVVATAPSAAAYATAPPAAAYATAPPAVAYEIPVPAVEVGKQAVAGGPAHAVYGVPIGPQQH